MRISVFLILGVCCFTANAAPITLKCTDSSGIPAADLIVDIAAGTMRWSISNYKITHTDKRYVSAQLVPGKNEVGGETWVLDRATGDYTRGGVAILATKFDGATPVDPKLQSTSYSGKCNAPLL